MPMRCWSHLRCIAVSPLVIVGTPLHTHMFKDYEIQQTMKMAKAGAAKWRNVKGPSDSEPGDEQDGQELSDTSDSCESPIK
jgi:hypothetical protein